MVYYSPLVPLKVDTRVWELPIDSDHMARTNSECLYPIKLTYPTGIRIGVSDPNENCSRRVRADVCYAAYRFYQSI
jgi:hypothetical protein